MRDHLQTYYSTHYNKLIGHSMKSGQILLHQICQILMKFSGDDAIGEWSLPAKFFVNWTSGWFYKKYWKLKTYVEKIFFFTHTERSIKKAEWW